MYTFATHVTCYMYIIIYMYMYVDTCTFFTCTIVISFCIPGSDSRGLDPIFLELNEGTLFLPRVRNPSGNDG